ncbi:GNAT family N-acetyltransferase [Luteimonas yindakuii]|uniref:GNAT family N-acetyltransferase n=1 Tax=Luteimonas yindakuii TaxID=2565782 RepID=A0A4Z1R358_9GAMM|nr:GNAT family N-acetyltransferase [Luteimonas yindakuii]TKS54094.1 GNAT family N-acetyltransferase [Luteimonas yindakuii]
MSGHAAPGPFQVATAQWPRDHAELLQVRGVVFIEEQGVPEALERDDDDPRSAHVVARDAGGQPIGTARLTPQRRIGRMAVLREWRGQGVGHALLEALLREARAQGLAEVALHAQVDAIGFYSRHGFVPEGPRFDEAGIEHQTMRRALARPQAIDDREAAAAIVTALVRGARRRLWVYSRHLDPGLFDDPQVLSALRRFGTRGGGVEARFLLQDPAAAQRAHAPLLPLAQRLPSVFTFRVVDDPVDRGYAPAYIATDGGGYYFRTLGNRFDGEAELDAPGRARQLRDSFSPVWERARPASEFRALGL